METQLDAIEMRIVGSLLEKALSTPDYYPLSLNALVNACNQKSSRDPVVAYDAATVETALDGLAVKGVVDCSRVGRVPKYEERFSRRHDLMPPEMAVLGVLLLRGPQTAGEVRNRTARMHRFGQLADVLETLDRLAEWGFSCQLARQPGHKEVRYAHLLGASIEAAAPEEDNVISDASSVENNRLATIETDIANLKDELTALKRAFEAFCAQFD